MSDRGRRSHSKDSGVSANNASLENSTVSDLLGSLSHENEDLDFEFEPLSEMDNESEVESNDSNSDLATQSSVKRHFRSRYLPRIGCDANNFRRNYLQYATTSTVGSERTLLDSSSEEEDDISEPDENALLETDDSQTQIASEVGKVNFEDEESYLNDSGNNSVASKSLDGDFEDGSCSVAFKAQETPCDKDYRIQQNFSKLKPISAANFSITLNVSSQKRNIVPKDNLTLKRKARSTKMGLDICDSLSEDLQQKRRKWDVKYDILKPLRLSLQDGPVKYTPEDAKDVNDNKKVLEKHGLTFKVPLTRPPARQKTDSRRSESSTSSCSSPFNEPRASNIKYTIQNTNISSPKPHTQTQPDIADDVISLLGSTSIYNTEEDQMMTPKLKEPLHDDDQLKIQAMSQAKVEEWIISSDQHSNMSNTSSNNEMVTRNEMTFRDKPLFLKGFCYDYFFRGYCKFNQNCIKGHEIRASSLARQINLRTPQEIEKEYNFAKNYKDFFKYTYVHFAKAFAFSGMRMNVVSVIKDIKNLNLDLGRAVDVVICSLEASKMTSIDAIDFLWENSTILHDAMENNSVLESWPVLKRLTGGTKKFNPEFATSLIQSVLSEPNKHLCQEVYQHLVGKNKINIERIPKTLMVQFRKCVMEMENKEQSLRNLENMVQAKLDREHASVEFQSAGRSNSSASWNNSYNGQSRPQNTRTIVFEPPKKIVEAQNNFTFGGISSNLFPVKLGNFPKHQTPPNPKGQPRGGPSRFMLSSTNTAGPFEKYLNRSEMFSGQNTPPLNAFVNRVSTQRDIVSNDNLAHRAASNYIADISPPDHHVRRSKNYESDSTGSSGAAPCFSPLSVMPKTPNIWYNSKGETYDPQKDYDYRPMYVNKTENNETNNVSLCVSPDHANENHTPTLNSKQQGNSGIQAPEKPVFGQLVLDETYDPSTCLHALYTQPIDRVNIDENDVLKLNATIITGDGNTYLDLLDKYKQPATVENFITMTIAHLKGMNQMIFKVYMKLLTSIEKINPYYFGITKIRAVLEVVTMNILYELRKRVMWTEAFQLLTLFTNWDTLITSRLFERYYSLMGRYLLIVNILVFADKCHSLTLAYDLLQCPSLHLLEAPEQWPFKCPRNIVGDLQLRDFVLRELFRMGYINNMGVVAQMYKKVKLGQLYKYDATIHISPMVSNLINQEKIPALKQLFQNDLNYFSQFLDKELLRACLCLLCNHIGVEDAFKLYEKCVEKGIYREIKGSETNIAVRTNMLDQELELILKYYFSKMTKSHSRPSSNIQFTVELPPAWCVVKYPKILDQTRSVFDIYSKLRSILNAFNILEIKSTQYSHLEVKMEDLNPIFAIDDDVESIFE